VLDSDPENAPNEVLEDCLVRIQVRAWHLHNEISPEVDFVRFDLSRMLRELMEFLDRSSKNIGHEFCANALRDFAREVESEIQVNYHHELESKHWSTWKSNRCNWIGHPFSPHEHSFLWRFRDFARAL
jgi:hypothetical protein